MVFLQCTYLIVIFVTVYCGICHTDVHYAENKRGTTKFPLVPGHELAGIVTKVQYTVKQYTLPGSRFQGFYGIVTKVPLPCQLRMFEGFNEGILVTVTKVHNTLSLRKFEGFYPRYFIYC